MKTVTLQVVFQFPEGEGIPADVLRDIVQGELALTFDEASSVKVTMVPNDLAGWLTKEVA